jgi:hypothetical protein
MTPDRLPSRGKQLQRWVVSWDTPQRCLSCRTAIALKDREAIGPGKGVKQAVFFRKEYLSWREQLTQDLGVTVVLCLGERVAERVLLPGLHRIAGRSLTDDPTKIDSLSLLFADALGLFALVWVFILTLYAMSYLLRRPLKSYAPLLVSGILVVFTFISSVAQWFQMPVTPP